MLVLGLGGAAVGIVSGDVSVTISGMSLASIIGILLNLFLKDDEDEEVEVIEEAPKKASKKEINELKDAIKNELTVELKAELIDEIKKELLKDKKETTKKVVKKTTKKEK
jgi:uncharacterized protein YpuA (DUF1002 family)